MESAPEDFAIWVQLGNSRKELGDYPGALIAYASAIKINDSDPDVHLQNGHGLKRAGRLPDAIAAYRRSVECGSESNPALLELAALAPEEIADIPNRDALLDSGVHAIYLDVTDLVDYLRVNTTLSGIQRVAANLVIYSRESCRTTSGVARNFVIPDYRGAKFFVVGAGLIEVLVRTVMAGYANRSVLDRIVAAVDQSKKLMQPKAGDSFIIPGAFWIYRHYDLLNRLRARGVSIAVFIHDLIQVRNPEYVHKDATEVFRICFADIAVVADKIITSSNFVANEVRRYVKEKFNFEIHLEVIPLATELDRLPGGPGTNEEFLHLIDDGYVLCVGTIEVRKNHLYLIRIWEKLIREFKGPIPNLVFVGKWGWDIEELREYIEDSDYLGARLFIYNGVSDSGLSWFFDNCLFTIFPSFAEGWGLPVGESLAFGKPCIASNTTSMPEVGGQLCKYFDPYDVEDGYRIVSEVLTDRSALAEWAKTIRRSFKPKTWRLFSNEFFQIAFTSGKNLKLNSRDNKSVIEIATVAPFGAAAFAELDARGEKLISARMSRMSGWHELESWGCWASQRRAVLRLRTKLPPGAKTTVYLHLTVPEEANLANCAVKSGDWITHLDNVGSTPAWRTAPCAVADDGVIELSLMSGKGFTASGVRERYVGIIAIAVVPADDKEARRRLVAQIVPES